MPKIPLDKVTKLSLREIAELWTPSARIPFSLMLRELRVAAINIPRVREGKELLPQIPPEHELPDPDDETVDYEWLVEFCEKQGWPTPDFWRYERGYVRPQGRPSYKQQVLKIYNERRRDNLTKDTISQEARDIYDRLHELGLEGVIPEPKTIQMHIREHYNAGELAKVQAE